MSIEFLTERAYQTWPSWFVVYEWEDVLANCLNCKIVPMYKTGRIGRKVRSVLKRAGCVSDEFSVLNENKLRLAWIMNANGYKMYTRNNIIPIFMDFHSDMVPTIAKATKKLPVYWVTSYHIYELMKEAGADNVQYMPLSISDKYIRDTVPEKTIDVIQFGRLNPILHQFMLNYCKKNPHVEYVYSTYDGSLVYVSTTRGEIGRFDKRGEYMKLLSSCKVSLVSSPGIDKGPNNVRDFGSNDFITPRFFESAALYSHMIGRYSNIKEVDMLGISDVCCNVRTQDQFDKELDRALRTDCAENIEKYKHFLANNVTSVRAMHIKEVYDKYLH